MPGYRFKRPPGSIRLFVLLTLLAVLGVIRWKQYQEPHSPPWQAHFEVFARRDATNRPPPGATLLVGSSSIQYWETLRRDFPNYQVYRRGLGGAQLEDLTRQADRLIIPYEPGLVLVYAGDNDLAMGKRPAEVLEEFRKLVEVIQLGQPGARVAFISIKPSLARWHLRQGIRDANELVKKYTQEDARLFYIDVFNRMLNSRGEPRRSLFHNDGLHLNESGYRLWAEVIRGFLAQHAPGHAAGDPSRKRKHHR